MRAKIEIRECSWVNGKAMMWQGHVYSAGNRMSEPLISGKPACSPILARNSLIESLYEYAELSRQGKELIPQYKIPRKIITGFRKTLEY